MTVLARGDRTFQIVESEPAGPVFVRLETIIRTRVPPAQRSKVGPSNVRYEDIGGLDRELSRVRELIELPMKYPQLFEPDADRAAARACCCTARPGPARR